MSITVTCTKCGHTLKARDESAGKKGKCPRCGEVFRIPQRSEVQSEAVVDAEPVEEDLSALRIPEITPPPAYKLVDDPQAAQQSTRAEGDARRPCPMCGEMIPLNAIKCRFCNEIFDPTLKKAQSAKDRRKKSGADADLTTGDWLVAILCSGIGCIAGIVWMIQGKPKGGKMVLVSIAFSIIWTVIRVVIMSSMQNNHAFR